MRAAERAAAELVSRLGRRPDRLVRAPGRVNLIGDHTDYQDGLVLPMAIDRDVVIAVAERDDAVVRLVSEGHDDAARFPVDDFTGPVSGWPAYVQGVAWALSGAGRQPVGFDGAIASDVPVGGGLSSSAALELAACLALLPGATQRLDAVELARTAQRAETEWVGMSCGIMDQLASAAGVAGHALRIDCRTMTVVPVPLPDEIAVLVLDTGTRRALVGSDYNTRREETERAAAALGVATLRDATTAAVAAHDLDPRLAGRALHVITENERVERFAAALAAGELTAAGAEMAASHASLRDRFAVVTPELEEIVAATMAEPGCYGARMTGAGFGGCAVALVDRTRAEAVATTAADRYYRRTGRTARVLTCSASNGPEELDVAGAPWGQEAGDPAHCRARPTDPYCGHGS